LKYINVVRKIQAVPCGDRNEANRVYQYLRSGTEAQNKAMNQMMNGLVMAHVSEMQKDDKKEFVKYFNRTGTTKLESAYVDVEFATGIPISAFVQKVKADFDTALKNGAAYGRVRFPEYKSDNPLLVHIDWVRLRKTNPHNDFGIYHCYPTDEEFEKHLYSKDLEIFWKFANGITFKLVFGNLKRSCELRSVFKNIFNETYEIRGSSIQINSKNQIILNMTIKMPVYEASLDENTVVGVDIGMAIPAMCALNNNPVCRQRIGSFDDFMRVKTQIKKERSRIQSSIRFGSGGHGREKKLKSMQKFRSRESNWAMTYNHTVSRKVVDFALKNHAKYINLEDLSGIASQEKSNKLLRDWTYFQLQQFITYKAEKVGIVVRKIDPYHTSQICSCCGHWEEGQRISQDKFICKNPECKNFGKIVNADFNAARNIAMSTAFVDEKKLSA